MRFAILYMIGIVAAEVVTNFVSMVGGVVFYAVILAALIIHSSLYSKPGSSNSRLLLALALVPLTRILSLSMPLARLAPVYWYIVIYPPLFLAAWLAKNRLNLTVREIGFNFGKLRVQLAVALSGVVFGVIEYFILRPAEPLVPELSLMQVLLIIIALGFGTGLVEEFIFRGVLQRISIEVLGKWGLVYVAFIFAALHLIHYSALDVVFVFVVGLFFGWVVNKTGSLLGVILSHSITNIILFVVIPLYPALVTPF